MRPPPPPTSLSPNAESPPCGGVPSRLCSLWGGPANRVCPLERARALCECWPSPDRTPTGCSRRRSWDSPRESGVLAYPFEQRNKGERNKGERNKGDASIVGHTAAQPVK